MNDIEKAIEILKKDNYTCVLVKDGINITSTKRGVKPLLEFIEQGIEKDFSACDKVVGNGAAYLYVLLKIKELHALVLSKPAKETLDKYGIKNTCDALVENIRNRTDTGICPMEKAVADAVSPENAKNKIIQKLKELS